MEKKIPKLRFPGFEGEWVEKKLGEIADVKTGPFGSVLHQHDYVEIGTPIITVEHLNEFGIVHKNLPLVSNEDRIRLKSYHLKKGDLVFSRVGSIDRCSIISNKEDGWLFSGRLLRVRFTNQNSAFFNYEFQLDKTKQKVRSIAVGQTMPSINTEILKSIELFSPTLPEQTKIANFLSTVDDKITQLKKKKELLEQYKKGVMQQIFSQKLRFIDENGEDFAEWEELNLKQILIERVEKTTESKQYRVLSSTTKGIFFQDVYFNREIASKDSTGYKILRRNQLVFSPQNLWLGNINVNIDYEIGIVSPSYKIFEFNKAFTSATYCKYFLLTPQMMFQYEQCSEQGASVVRRNLDMNLFLEIWVLLPSLPNNVLFFP